MNARGRAGDRFAVGLMCLITAYAGPLHAESRYFDSNGVRLHYTDQGSGQPVVLVHGFTQRLTVWSEHGIAQRRHFRWLVQVHIQGSPPNALVRQTPVTDGSRPINGPNHIAIVVDEKPPNFVSGRRAQPFATGAVEQLDRSVSATDRDSCFVRGKRDDGIGCGLR